MVDPAGRRVEVRGVELRLTAHEYELIALLETEPGRVFTKQELLRELWGEQGHQQAPLTWSHASRTRCKLRDAGTAGFIVNCHGQGHRLSDQPV